MGCAPFAQPALLVPGLPLSARPTSPARPTPHALDNVSCTGLRLLPGLHLLPVSCLDSPTRSGTVCCLDSPGSAVSCPVYYHLPDLHLLSGTSRLSCLLLLANSIFPAVLEISETHITCECNRSIKNVDANEHVVHPHSSRLCSLSSRLPPAPTAVPSSYLCTLM